MENEHPYLAQRKTRNLYRDILKPASDQIVDWYSIQNLLSREKKSAILHPGLRSMFEATSFFVLASV